nr:PREDICTED: protein D3-like [Bemisia tabaci]
MLYLPTIDVVLLMTPYMKRLLLLIVSIFSVVQSGLVPQKFIHGSIKKAFVVPDAYTKAPDYGIEIWFGNHQVEYGNHLWIDNLKEKPTHINWVHNKKDRFTLIMSGLDAPSSDDPHDREALYWMVGNILETNIEDGEHWAPYVQPWPLQGAGPHRVIFTIYKQYRGRKINFKEKKLGHRIIGGERKNFSTRKFGERYSLGAPWAANFFDLFDNSSYPPWANINN